jgi:hypothetical protein
VAHINIMVDVELVSGSALPHLVDGQLDELRDVRNLHTREGLDDLQTHIMLFNVNQLLTRLVLPPHKQHVA